MAFQIYNTKCLKSKHIALNFTMLAIVRPGSFRPKTICEFVTKVQIIHEVPRKIRGFLVISDIVLQKCNTTAELVVFSGKFIYLYKPMPVCNFS